MADYTTRDIVKAALSIALVDTVDDVAIDRAVTAASRQIDRSTNRVFDLAGVATERRYQVLGDFVATDDIGTSTGVVIKVDEDGDGTAERTLDTTEQALYPFDALAQGFPATAILLTSKGTKGRGRYHITARWGWPAVPIDIEQAALLQAVRFVQRRSAPFGVAGSLELGTEVRLLARLDPDVEALVRPYVAGWWAR